MKAAIEMSGGDPSSMAGNFDKLRVIEAAWIEATAEKRRLESDR